MADSSIKKAKNGTYYFRVHLGYSQLTGKQIQKYCSGFKTKKDAKNEYLKLVNTSEEEIARDVESMFFKEFVETIFYPWYKTKVSLRVFKSRLQGMVKNFAVFYTKKLSKITPLQVQSWQLEMIKQFSPAYTRTLHNLLIQVFERAKILELVKDNPASVIGKVKKTKVQINFWTKDEFEKVISIIDTEEYFNHFIYVCLWLLFMSGMRIGEASALQWSDINFETGVLVINKSLYYQNLQTYEFTSTKTVSSNRNIVLDNDTLDILEEWKKRQSEVIECGFILSYSGTPVNNSSINQIIKRYSAKVGVHSISVHGLRHSHASLLIQLGENPLVVRDRLGHKDVETTLATYSHLYPKMNVEVASKLQGIVQR